ncbi:unnamed protein product, partial [Amoebophrya sp. A120]
RRFHKARGLIIGARVFLHERRTNSSSVARLSLANGAAVPAPSAGFATHRSPKEKPKPKHSSRAPRSSRPSQAAAKPNKKGARRGRQAILHQVRRRLARGYDPGSSPKRYRA